MICFVLLSGTRDVKELFALLKGITAELNGSSDVLKYQVLNLIFVWRALIFSFLLNVSMDICD